MTEFSETERLLALPDARPGDPALVAAAEELIPRLVRELIRLRSMLFLVTVGAGPCRLDGGGLCRAHRFPGDPCPVATVRRTLRRELERLAEAAREAEDG